MRKLLYTLFCILPYTLYAQNAAYQLEGTVTAISPDSVITLTITVQPDAAPPLKQMVSVYNKMVSGNFTGTVGIADAEITSYGNGIATLQVLKYTSSIIKDGKSIPLIKVNNTALLKWEMPFVATYRSEHNRADDLMAEGGYEEALRIMDSLYSVKTDIEVLYSRGVCLYNMSNYTRVVEDMNTLIGMDSAYVMAYYFRACAYREMDDHDGDALKDLDYVLKYKSFTDEDLEVQMRLERIQLVQDLYAVDSLSETVMKDKLCADYTRLYKLNPDEIMYYSEKNYYCKMYKMNNAPVNYMPVKAIVQNNFSIEVKVLKKNKYKWFNKEHKQVQTVSVGTYVYIDIISEDNSMNIALAKVVKVEGSTLKLQIEYMHNYPYDFSLVDSSESYIITW